MTRKNRLISIIAGSLIGLAVLALLSPYLAAFALGHLLVGQGFGFATVERLAIHPVDGRIELRGLQAGRTAINQLQLNSLQLELDTAALLDRTLRIRSLKVDGLRLHLQQFHDGSLQLGGLLLPATTPAPPPVTEGTPRWRVELQSLSLNDDQVNILTPQLRAELLIDNGIIDQLSLPQGETNTHFSLNGVLNEAPLQLQGEARPFDEAPSGKLTFKLEGLELARLLPRLPQLLPELEHYQARVSIDTRVEATAGLTSVRQQGTLHIDTLHLQQYGLGVEAESLEWQGTLELASLQPSLSGRLGLTALNLSERGHSLLSAGSIDIADIQLANSRRLSVGTIDMRSLQLRVALDKQGQPQLPKLRGATLKKVSASEDDMRPPTSPADSRTEMALHLGPLAISEATIHFRDDSVSPSFQERLLIQTLRFSGLDTEKPDDSSELTLKARIGDFALIDLQAKARPFTPKVNLEAQLGLKQLELPPLSPYLAKLLGYQFENGQLGQQLKLTIEDNQMEGKADIHLSNLDVEEAVQVSEQSLKAKLEVPLGTALALLRDNDNNIQLNVPFKGDIAAPNFDAGNVINTALAKALKVGGLGYLKLALQPYGTALSVLQMAGKALKYIPLDPVPYAPGKSAAEAADAQYLQKLSALMGKRPGLRLRLCGFATETDRQLLAKGEGGKPREVNNEELRALAAERSRALKKRMVDEHGLDPARLFLCHPELDEDGDAEGRVEIGI